MCPNLYTIYIYDYVYIYMIICIYIFKIWQVNVVILCKYFEWFQVLVDAL